MPNHLVVIYGPPLAGKTTVAWQVARSFGEKTAVVSLDNLLGGAIAVSDDDSLAELEMAHTQLRLLVVNYLKNRYHVVVEGPFCFERDGAVRNAESEIDQLVALMRHLTDRALIVRLDASEATLVARASSGGRDAELAGAQRVAGAYKQRGGERFVAVATDALAPEAVAERIIAAFERLAVT